MNNSTLLRWLLLLLACCLSPGTVAFATPTFTVAASLNRSAMTLDIEQQLSEAYQALGYQLHIQYLPAERSLKMSNNGQFDGELFRIAAITEQYPQLVQVPVAIAQIELYAIVKTERSNEFSNWQHNEQLRIGFVRGFKMAERYQVAGHPIVVNTTRQAVRMLQQGKIDLLLEDLLSLREVTKGAEHQAGLSLLPKPLASQPLFHFVHQQHRALVPALSQQLQRQLAGKKRKKSASVNGGDQK